MTAGMHHRWRERAVDLARVGPGRARSTWPPAQVTSRSRCARAARRSSGIDFSEAMLELARAKAPGSHFEEGDALALPFADGAFDAVTVGFGARNFSDLDRGSARWRG